jgi:hypothetical protein
VAQLSTSRPQLYRDDGVLIAMKNKKFLVIVCFGVLYVGLWLVTHFAGETKVRNAARDAFVSSHLDSMKARESGGRPPSMPTYRFAARAYAPFIVRVAYGWKIGTHAEGGSTLYCWFFGRSYLIREFGHETEDH